MVMNSSYFVLSLALTLFCQYWQSVQGEDEPKPPLILIPRDLGEVLYGDPIFVPISLSNRLKVDGYVPSLMSCCFFVPGQRWRGDCKLEFFGNFSSSVLPSGQSQTTVVALDIWHPRVSKALYGAEVVELRFEESNRDNPKRSSIDHGFSNSTKVKIVGSAFRDDAMVLRAGRTHPEMPNTIRTSALNVSFLAMLQLPNGEVLDFGAMEWIGPNWQTLAYKHGRKAEYYRRNKASIVGTSSLYRLIRLYDLLVDLKEAIDTDNRSETDHANLMRFLSNFKDNLQSAKPAEYEFHVRTLDGLALILTPKDMELVVQEFPLVLGILDPYSREQEANVSRSRR